MRDRAAARGRVVGLAVAAAAWLGVAAAAPPAGAVEPESCPLWFPDFRCNRDVRPDGHIAPVTMPFFFEDPYVATDLQLVGTWNALSNGSMFEGGNSGSVGLQARVAITERFAFILTKAAFSMWRPDSPDFSDQNGFTDVTLGLKYKWLDDRETGLVLTPSLRYEIPIGAKDVFNGYGSGAMIPALTGGWTYEQFHSIASFGGYIPIDDDRNSSLVFYNVHLDYAISTGNDWVRFVVPFFEMNGIHWTGSGNGENSIRVRSGKVEVGELTSVFGRFEALDAGNIGTRGIAGKNHLFLAGGLRMPLRGGVSLAAAYEAPAVDRSQDFFDRRVTFAARYQF